MAAQRRRRPSRGAAVPPPCPHAHTHGTSALSAPVPGLRPARGGAAGPAGPHRACAAGPGKRAHAVRSCRRCVGPQMEPAPGAAGRGGRQAGGKEGGKRPPDILTSPPPSSPPLPLASPGFLWETPVAFRWPFTPTGESGGVGCGAPPVGAGKGHPRGLRPVLREVPGGLGRSWCPQRAPGATSLLPSLPLCCHRRDLQRRDAGRRQLRGVRVPAVASLAV